eukprot:TRINITY_DN24418_c0_g1_i4.p1 TRINITY_DN24418_c0_g1~~TRINITY_DN24418_c0_g1_i4.p1  ORF type:complete len:243 (-),score=-13.55 TRINITY_DN24418_c0_g1_i4:47-775(-)
MSVRASVHIVRQKNLGIRYRVFVQSQSLYKNFLLVIIYLSCSAAVYLLSRMLPYIFAQQSAAIYICLAGIQSKGKYPLLYIPAFRHIWQYLQQYNVALNLILFRCSKSFDHCINWQQNFIPVVSYKLQAFFTVVQLLRVSVGMFCCVCQGGWQSCKWDKDVELVYQVVKIIINQVDLILILCILGRNSVNECQQSCMINLLGQNQILGLRKLVYSYLIVRQWLENVLKDYGLCVQFTLTVYS